jgi:hypothetical protein
MLRARIACSRLFENKMAWKGLPVTAFSSYFESCVSKLNHDGIELRAGLEKGDGEKIILGFEN